MYPKIKILHSMRVITRLHVQTYGRLKRAQQKRAIVPQNISEQTADCVHP